MAWSPRALGSFNRPLAGARQVGSAARHVGSAARHVGSAALLVGTLALGAACSAATGTSTSEGSTSGTGAGGDGQGGAGASSSITTTTTTSTTSSSSSSQGGGGESGGGLPTLCPPDADGDDIPDDVEGKDEGADTDGDGTPDFLDLDSDGDTLPDKIEGQTEFLGCHAPQDSDVDGKPDFRDTDSDGNGLLDRKEIYPDQSAYDPELAAPNPADSDGDGVPDYADPDNDDDSLPDTDELKAGAAIDTDLDGVPDLDDADSDGDSLGDKFEGLADPDADAIPAFRDLDSDGDGLLDACEAGPGHDVASPPPDSDNDGAYDFLDVDADGDGLRDAVEDANLDCVLDDDETDPFVADTDDDGTNDLIEGVLSSDPRDPLETPGTLGKYYFVMPYLQDPVPATNIVALPTNLKQGDIGFIVDTTATMGGAIQNLKIGMNGIVQSLYTQIPDLAVGIAGHDDFPTDNYGAVGVDQPFYVAGPKGYVSTVLADNLSAILTLNVHDGGDFPESQVAAYYRSLTDAFLLWDSGSMAPSGAPGGTYGSLHFRTGSLPILVGITDAAFHNGKRADVFQAPLHDTYVFNGTPPFPTPTVDDLVTKMTALGARYIGLNVHDGVRGGSQPYEDMAYLADQVASTVPASAFGGAQCGTGLAGSLLPPDGPAAPGSPGGTCRLVFDVSTNGSGVSESVVSGVIAVLKSLKFDMRALAKPGPEAIDTVDTFVQSVSVNASGGDDAAEPGVPCLSLNAVQQITDVWSGPKGLLKAQDAVNETALGIVPTQKICFKVTPIPNTTFPQTDEAQVFTSTLIVKAKNGSAPLELVLGTPREIAFIVPPSPQ